MDTMHLNGTGGVGMSNSRPAFDTLSYSKILQKKGGFSVKQADAQASVLLDVVNTNLATKSDLHDLKEVVLKTESSLNHKIDQVEISLNNKIDQMGTSLNHKIDQVGILVDHKVFVLGKSLDNKIAICKRDIIIWLGGLMASSIGIVSALVVFLK